MYVIIFACFLAAFVTPTLAAGSRKSKLTNEPFKEAPMAFFKSCQAESGATRADLEMLKMRKLPETKSGRCFLQCLFNSVKIMNDGKFNKHGMVIVFSPSMKGDLAKMGKLKELSEVCEREIGTKEYDNCEGAKKVVECVARNGKAYGIDFPRSKNM